MLLKKAKKFISIICSKGKGKDNFRFTFKGKHIHKNKNSLEGSKIINKLEDRGYMLID